MKTGRIAALGSFGALAALLALTGLAAGAANDTTLVSRASGTAGAVSATSVTVAPSISADGRYVAFQSDSDLDPDSNDAVADIFVRDTQANTTTLVSRASGVAGAAGDGASVSPSISPDGRYVAFQSDADNLDSESHDEITDIFLRDMQDNTTTLVNRSTGAAGAIDLNGSFSPSVSSGGQYVAFVSTSDTFDPDGNDAAQDIFVRDTQANTTTLVSRATGATGTVGNLNSDHPSISADGRHVAFESDADTLDPDNDVATDVFVRDTQANTTTLVSRASGAAGEVGENISFLPSISADGRYVAFESSADNLDPDSSDSVTDIFVRDTQADTTTLASRANGVAGAVALGGSESPSVSVDGRYVAFDSAADNLDPDSNDLVEDVFVRDMQAGTTTLASRAPGAAGEVGNGNSFEPSASANGRIAFLSDAGNLDLDSNDNRTDVFVRELAPPAVAPPGPGPAPIATPPAVAPFDLSAAIKKCRRRFKGNSSARKKKLKNCIKNARKRASGR